MRVCVNTNETKWDNCVVTHETTWDTFRDVILSGHVVADDRLAVPWRPLQNPPPWPGSKSSS